MSLKLLQERIGVIPDGSFGPATLKAAMKYFGFTPEYAAHFFGQIAHETGGFLIFSENLNYSASGLLATFGKYFTPELAEQYARQPVKIASRVYANRMGNGNEASKDGYTFRGRGAIQLTGKANYQAFANDYNDSEIMINQDLVATKYSFDSAKFFFDRNNIWSLANIVTADSILAITKKINGGTNGLADRISLTNRYFTWLTN